MPLRVEVGTDGRSESLTAPQLLGTVVTGAISAACSANWSVGDSGCAAYAGKPCFKLCKMHSLGPGVEEELFWLHDILRRGRMLLGVAVIQVR